MIPKTIHYCWFGNKSIPKEQQAYIDGWKKLMPDYTFKCWNESNIDISKVPFAQQAYDDGKLAFVADYTRIYALYHEGGIYMDTDVKVFQSFDQYLNFGVFTSYEYNTARKDLSKLSEVLTPEGDRKDKSLLKVPGNGLLSALIGAEKGHPMIKDCYDFYNNANFRESYALNLTIPTVLALQSEKYGFKYINKEQRLKENIMIYDTSVFSDYHNSSKKSIAIHYCEGSWVKKSLKNKIKSKLYRISWLRKTVKSIFSLFQ